MKNNSASESAPVTAGAADAPKPGKPSDLRICNNPVCNFETYEPLKKCPKCRRSIWTAFEFRVLSLVLVICGLLLTGIGGGLIALFANFIAGKNAGGVRPEGGEAVAAVFYGIFGVILALGLSVTAAGAWQLIRGRTNRMLTFTFVIWLVILLLIFGFGRLVLRLIAE